MSDLIFCLLGPTASGKTDLAISLVDKFNFEIISVDSALIYREMNIGTAKPSAEIMQRYSHHLVDIINPDETYSVKKFLTDVNAKIEDIKSRGKVPLLVGGTMMYFHAFNNGLANLPDSDPQIRNKLSQQIKENGLEYLYQQLIALDPESSRINHNDTQRIIRALEVTLITNKPFSSFLKDTKDNNYNVANLLLAPLDRSILHKRIEQRFHIMLENGFIEEVKYLHKKYNLDLTYSSMRCVGYRQILKYLLNEYTQADMIYKSIVATRQLAKRQLTWLRSFDFGKNFNFACEDPDLVAQVSKVVDKLLNN